MFVTHRLARQLTLGLGCISALASTHAGQLQPSGLNVGNTSFFDGFSRTTPGWTLLEYLQHTRSTRINDDSGQASPAFRRPRIYATLLVSQLAYTSGITFFDGSAHLGFNAVLPLANLRASFDQASAARLSARSGMGDLLLESSLQFDPVIDGGRPVYSQRLAFAAIAPVGSYRVSADINPGSNFWSAITSWAATWLPTERTEVSWRLNYLYNFSNDRPANLPPNVTKTQAGQAAWLNFTGSYAVLPNLNIGVNGYYYRQLTDDRYRYVDGFSDSGAMFGNTGKSSLFAIGPGLSWKLDKSNILNVNAYFQTQARNRARGNTLNFNWIHPL